MTKNVPFKRLAIERYCEAVETVVNRNINMTIDEFKKLSVNSNEFVAITSISMVDTFKDNGMQVYALDDDFANSIASQDWYKLLPELVGRWPYDCFYIKTSVIEGEEGCLVYMGPPSERIGPIEDHQIISLDSTGKFHLVKRTSKLTGPDIPDDRQITNYFIFDGPDLDTSQGREIVVETLLSETTGDDSDVKLLSIPAQYPGSMAIELWYNLLAYICSANADINTVYTPPKPVKGKRPNKAKGRKHSQCTVHQVGYHIGAELRAYEHRMAAAVDADDDADSKRSVRPHMRRAHWHHYWTGPRDVPEERQLVIRWVAPTFVGGTADDIDAPTIHKIR